MVSCGKAPIFKNRIPAILSEIINKPLGILVRSKRAFYFTLTSAWGASTANCTESKRVENTEYTASYFKKHLKSSLKLVKSLKSARVISTQ